MDIDNLRGLATLFAFSAFIAVCLWAYSKRNKPRFDDAAHLPFADEAEHIQGQHATVKNKEVTP